jgi:hypothetical protein
MQIVFRLYMLVPIVSSLGILTVSFPGLQTGALSFISLIVKDTLATALDPGLSLTLTRE